MVPDIAAYERSAHTRLSSRRRARWNQCHVLFVGRAPFSLSFLAVFYINRKPYFSALISKRKFGRATGERRNIEFVWQWSTWSVRVKGWGKKMRQWGKYWHQIFPPFCCRAEYVSPCFIFELLSQKEFPYSIVCNFLTFKANLEQFQVFSFILCPFLHSPEVSCWYFYKCTHY